MKHKIQYASIFMCSLIVFLTGCEQSSLTTAQSANDKTETAAQNTEMMKVGNTDFPAEYHYESDKISVNVVLDIPESLGNQTLFQHCITRETDVDPEAAYEQFVAGHEIVEQHEFEDTKDTKGSIDYILSDGESVSIGNGFSYGSSDSRYYNYVGVSLPENRSLYLQKELDFESEKDAADALRQQLSQLGYPSEDLQIVCYSARGSEIREMESEYVKSGLLESSRKKGNWSDEDDVYILYAFQKLQGLPLAHQGMTIYRIMASFSSDNAPVSAIRSKRGWENLMVNDLYEFEQKAESCTLKEFPEIAGGLTRKYEYLLDESHYTTKCARLIEAVHLNQERVLEVFPVWYFEVSNDAGKVYINMFDAQTAEELYLGS